MRILLATQCSLQMLIVDDICYNILGCGSYAISDETETCLAQYVLLDGWYQIKSTISNSFKINNLLTTTISIFNIEYHLQMYKWIFELVI